ncbi:MAG: nucleotidyltransferase family protein [Rhodospirillaceae bacterium]|nr:nucleotidyltransferase family protein [Rhodospirillaceae bacterium]
MATFDAINALILAGGLGTRLRPVVGDRPKALANVSGRPFLDHQLTWLSTVGVKRVLLALGHEAEPIRDHVAKDAGTNLDIVCSIENTPMGTGGAIRHALPLIDSETVLVLNGDTLVDVDLIAFAAFHAQHPDGLSLVLTHLNDTSRFGRVICDDANQVRSFGEKNCAGPGWINAGIYLMPRAAILTMPEGTFSLETDVLAAAPPPELYGFAKGKGFIDIGTPESYARADAFTADFGKTAL